jgi:hypothetical protein
VVNKLHIFLTVNLTLFLPRPNRVHRDFPGDDESLFNEEHGLTRDDWWNVWVLLSENSFGTPLVMLDPTLVAHTRPGYLWPQEFGGDSRAFTFDKMQRGDAMLWRTTRVPHTAGELVRPPGWTGWEGNFTSIQKRQSIDFRCTCVDNYRGTTKKRREESIYHGSQSTIKAAAARPKKKPKKKKKRIAQLGGL